MDIRGRGQSNKFTRRKERGGGGIWINSRNPLGILWNKVNWWIWKLKTDGIHGENDEEEYTMWNLEFTYSRSHRT